MEYLLDNRKLTFTFPYHYVECVSLCYYYQNNSILSFAVLDLAYKIIKQYEKRDYIVLKKRRPIINLLNYIDALNFNSKKFDIVISKYGKKLKLANSLYRYQNKHSKLEANLKVEEKETSCFIRYAEYASSIQPRNVNFVAMLMNILEKKREEIDASDIIFYCMLLM